MLERLVDWPLSTMLDLGYPGIVALMAMESSILPVYHGRRRVVGEKG